MQASIPGISIRRVDDDEIALLMDLSLRCWTGTVAANSSLYRETPDYVRRQIVRPDGGAVFLCLHDEPIGAARFFRVPGPAGDERPWVELKRVGVLRDHRKLGLGPILVDAVEAAAREQLNPAGAQIGVRDDQPRLVAFWSSLGYVLADDVQLSTRNELTPPPITLRKRFLTLES